MDWATPSIKTCATLSLMAISWNGPVYLGLSDESEIVLIQTCVALVKLFGTYGLKACEEENEGLESKDKK